MIKITKSFNTTERVKELVSNLRYLSTVDNNSFIQILPITFITPLSITPVAALINKKNLQHNYEGENKSYLNTIHFPDGIKQIDNLNLSNRTYLPIINLSLEGLNSINSAKMLGLLTEQYLHLLKNNVIADPIFLKLITDSTLGLLLQEMMDNIQEHALAKNVYLFAQYWPKTNNCEFCLLDDGQGLYSSLIKAGRSVYDDEDAMRQILDKGLSAKTEFGNIRRGTGIKTTRALITNKEINGEFLIMSGDTVFLHSASSGEIFFKLSDFTWQGTIVMGRLNRPLSQFDWSQYVK